MNVSALIVFVAIGSALEIIQNTLLDFIAIRGVHADLILIVASYTAFQFGSQTGQVSGFLLGIVEDAVAITPFGFHSIVRLVHSSILGLARGTVALDYVVIPVLLVIIASGIKVAMVAAVTAVFSLNDLANPVWTISTLIEISYTAAVAPLVFAALRKIKKPDG